MKTDLLFDFTVDKATKTVLVTREFDAGLSLDGMLLPNRKFLTNGGRLNPIHQKQNIWISKLADEDFMLW